MFSFSNILYSRSVIYNKVFEQVPKYKWLFIVMCKQMCIFPIIFQFQHIWAKKVRICSLYRICQKKKETNENSSFYVEKYPLLSSYSDSRSTIIPGIKFPEWIFCQNAMNIPGTCVINLCVSEPTVVVASLLQPRRQNETKRERSAPALSETHRGRSRRFRAAFQF